MRDDAATDELWTPSGQAARATLADIWHGNPYPTAGSMLRRIEVPDWYDRLNLTDWPLYVLAATGGELHFDPAPAACYRLHAGGAFSGLTDRQKLQRTDEFYRQMDRHLAGRFTPAGPRRPLPPVPRLGPRLSRRRQAAARRRGLAHEPCGRRRARDDPARQLAAAGLAHRRPESGTMKAACRASRPRPAGE